MMSPSPLMRDVGSLPTPRDVQNKRQPHLPLPFLKGCGLADTQPGGIGKFGERIGDGKMRGDPGIGTPMQCVTK